jgi:hypothetical protein
MMAIVRTFVVSVAVSLLSVGCGAADAEPARPPGTDLVSPRWLESPDAQSRRSIVLRGGPDVRAPHRSNAHTAPTAAPPAKAPKAAPTGD